MAHVRAQIRERFKTVLDAALGAGYDIYASRKYSHNIKTGTALVDMRFLNDQTSDVEAQLSGVREHTGSLYIRVQRPAMESDLDDLLDADETSIVEAVEAENFRDLLTEDPELMQVNFSDDASGAQAVGAIVLRFDVEYRIEKDNPETVVP